MTQDDDETDTPKIADAPATNEIYAIPAQLLEQWFRVDQNEYVDFSLTRADIDRVFASFYNLYSSVTAVQKCLIHWSNGGVEDANSKMLQSQKLSSEALNEARQVMASIMISGVTRKKS